MFEAKGVATPISEMKRILAVHPEYQKVIFPYIGGEEVNTSSTHSHHRHVINFSDRSEEECRKRWPELMAIVEAKVRPDRETQGSIVNPARWWMFARSAADLYAAITGIDRVLVISQVTQHITFALLPSGMVYSHRLYVFPFESHSTFAVLQSRTHEIWARFFGSSLEERFMYAAVDCFETFPFPEGWETHTALEDTGKAYYEFRAALMVRNNEGLTKTYNRFHDLDEREPDILKLRELHAAMDKAVLNAYGWGNIDTSCEFLLDYEIDEEEWGDRKKPWRYRWSDEIQAEVLARLLELNAERAQSEARAGTGTEGLVQKGKMRGRKPRPGHESDSSPTLFDGDKH